MNSGALFLYFCKWHTTEWPSHGLSCRWGDERLAGQKRYRLVRKETGPAVAKDLAQGVVGDTSRSNISTHTKILVHTCVHGKPQNTRVSWHKVVCIARWTFVMQWNQYKDGELGEVQ
jgi:hypothetical protein